MKRCSGCKIEKDESEFYKNRALKDGLNHYCKSCWKAKLAEDPDRQRRRYRENPERGRAKAKAWYRDNFYRKYGLSKEEYDALLQKQNGVCAICKNPPSGEGRWGKIKRLYIDHNHKTGKVRGLLCRDHNSAVGLFQDSPELLKTAAIYLESDGLAHGQ